MKTDGDNAVELGMKALGALGYNIRVLTPNRSMYMVGLPAVVVETLFSPQKDGRYYVEIHFDQAGKKIIIGMPLDTDRVWVEAIANKEAQS